MSIEFSLGNPPDKFQDKDAGGGGGGGSYKGVLVGNAQGTYFCCCPGNNSCYAASCPDNVICPN